MDFKPIPEYNPIEPTEFRDWHAVTSITLGELKECGFYDLTRPDWDFNPKFSTEQHARLCMKITNHYWFREIALVPPGIWKHEFLRKLNEIMPKYMDWYKTVADGVILGSEGEYYKSRNVFSDFPQTSLQGRSQDYASTGNDVEYERIRQLDPLELGERLKRYDDIDLSIVNELEPLFSCLLSVNINAF